MIRSGTLRFARYQAFDFLMQKVSLPTILVLVIGGLTVYSSGHQRSPVDWTSVEGTRFAMQILKQTMGIFFPLTAFLAVNAITSSDRQHGHVRFFFSKPVVVPWFYLQAWMVYGALMIVVAGLLTLVLQAFTTTLPVGAVMEGAALTWVLVGGLGYFLSSFIRMDGAILILGWLVSSILRSFAAQQDSPLPDWARLLAKIGPPADRLDAVRNLLVDGGTPSTSALSHIIAYGLIGLVLGTLIVRRRSLVT